MEAVKNKLKEIAGQCDLIDITMCCYLYRVCKGKQFDGLTGTDFAQLLNLRELSNPVKVRYRENTRVCYMIHAVSQCIENEAYSKAWIELILEKCNISSAHFYSHYKDPVSTRTNENKTFVTDIQNAIKIAQTM
jgi:hypothetical protein